METSKNEMWIEKYLKDQKDLNIYSILNFCKENFCKEENEKFNHYFVKSNVIVSDPLNRDKNCYEKDFSNYFRGLSLLALNNHYSLKLGIKDQQSIYLFKKEINRKKTWIRDIFILENKKEFQDKVCEKIDVRKFSFFMEFINNMQTVRIISWASTEDLEEIKRIYWENFLYEKENNNDRKTIGNWLDSINSESTFSTPKTISTLFEEEWEVLEEREDSLKKEKNEIKIFDSNSKIGFILSKEVERGESISSLSNETGIRWETC